MIKEIIKDQFILSQISTDASLNEDFQTINDLIDTLKSNQEICVGMAANMIGVLKNIIIFYDDNDHYVIMLNPKIIKKDGEYITKESCLSHIGERETKRYKKIKVEYIDIHNKKKIKTYHDFTAQIIQHEIDHLNGILI
jgi:peptide deformylase